MHPLFVLLRKDIRSFLRYKSSLVITFLVPVVLIWLFGFVFGINRKDSGPTGIPLAVVNRSADPAAASLVEALKAEKAFRIIDETKDAQGKSHPLTEAEARAAMKDNQYRFTLVLPEDLLSDERLGLRLQFLQDPRNEIETQLVNGLVQRTLFTKVPDLLGQSLQRRAKKMFGAAKMESFNRNVASQISDTFGVDEKEVYESMEKGDLFGTANAKEKSPAKTPEGLRRLDAPANASPSSPNSVDATTGEKKSEKKSAEDLLASILKIESEQVMGKQVKNPMAARLIGGYAVMFLLFAVSGFASSFFEEKRTGIFQRVLATSATRNHIIFSKFLFCVLLGLFQLSVLFLFGKLLYGIELWQHLVPLIAMILAASAACASFGMVIAAVSATPHAANSLSTLLVLIMSSIGGAWFPVAFMPEFIQKIAKLTVVYWSVEGLTNILWADYGLIQSLPFIGVLLLMALLCQGFALWRFRRGNLFD